MRSAHLFFLIIMLLISCGGEENFIDTDEGLSLSGVNPGVYYTIMVRHSGKFMDVAGASKNDGADVIQWEKNGKDNQTWQFVGVGDGYYKIKAKHSGKCLDVDGGAPDEGANVQQMRCGSGDNQKWKLKSAGEGYYYLQAKHSGKYANVSYGNKTNGATVKQVNFYKSDEQKWKIEAVSDATSGENDNDGNTDNSGAISPWEMVKKMGRGTNMGNTLDAPTEGKWAKAAEKYFFDDYKNAGYKTVRIPVRWDSRTDGNVILAEFMNRVETIVDWSLAKGLVTIINTHHEDWLKKDYEGNIVRFEAIWKQIAARFRNKSPNLLFEIFNEPDGNMSDEQVNDLNRRILPIIRKTNPTRIVIITSPEWNSRWALMKRTIIPDDKYTMGTVHYYNPMPFTHDGEPAWGTKEERQKLISDITSLAEWSKEKNFPVLVGEFGTKDTANWNDRLDYYKLLADEIIKNGMAFTVWDDGGWFGIYDRDGRKFNGLKKQIIGF